MSKLSVCSHLRMFSKLYQYFLNYVKKEAAPKSSL